MNDFPNIVQIILEQNKATGLGDQSCRNLAADINRSFLDMVIELLTETDQFDQIFQRLKKTFHDSAKNFEKKRIIIWWYT